MIGLDVVLGLLVLVAVIGFALGVVVVVLAIRHEPAPAALRPPAGKDGPT